MTFKRLFKSSPKPRATEKEASVCSLPITPEPPQPKPPQPAPSLPKPTQPESVKHKQRKLIVGIDFGTTYSGICFTLSSATELKDIQAWTKYPGSSSHQGGHYEKVPSIVAFASENADLSTNAWGYLVEPGMKSYTCFKLLLDEAALPTEYDDPQLQASTAQAISLLPAGMTAKQVVTEYLRGLHAMFQDAVVSFLGRRISDEMPMEFWLTVPATWTEKAKVLTRQAAFDAGFGKRPIDSILLIPEPEAGAHLALRASLHQVEDLVEVGSDILVCDCGGGTVDIVTYEVERTSPTLITEEICVGIGGKCGGTYVDRNLQALMTKRFGSAFTSLPIHERGPGSPFMDSFEHKKRDFDLIKTSGRPVKILLPMDDVPAGMDEYYDKRNYVLLSHDDMTSLFEPVVDMIIRLIEDQVRQVKQLKAASIDTLVLIGGFGSSPYLRHRLEAWCARSEIRLTTPWHGAWSAVVCGAVLRGIEGSIVPIKKCRKHYGVAVGLPYDPKKHAHYDTTRRYVYKHEFYKKDYLSGFMSWEIKKGAIVDKNTEFCLPLGQSISKGGMTDFTMTIFACSLDDAPATVEHDRVETVGQVKCTIEQLDYSAMPDTIDEKGEKCYLLSLKVIIHLGSDVGHMVFRVVAQGKEIGKAELDISTH